MEPGIWGLLAPFYYGYNRESLDTIRKRGIHLDTLQLSRHIRLQEEEERKTERDDQDLGKTD